MRFMWKVAFEDLVYVFLLPLMVYIHDEPCDLLSLLSDHFPNKICFFYDLVFQML